MINHFILSGLITSVTTLFLALFVFLANPNKRLNRYFAFYTLCISLWSISVYMHQPTLAGISADMWGKILHVGSILIPLGFLIFTFELLGSLNREKIVIYSAGVASAVFIYLTMFTDLLINGTTYRDLYCYPTPSKYYILFFIYFVSCVIYGLFKLVRSYQISDNIKRNQLQYLIFGSVFGYLGGLDNFLITIDIIVFPFYPYGAYAIAIYSLITAYAIVTARLMDIEVIIRKGLIYSILSVILTAVYFSVVYAAKLVFYRLTGANTLWFIVPAVFFLSLFIHPLFSFVQDFVDKRFFKTKYEADKIAKKFSEGIKKLMRAKDLAEYINRVALRTFKLKGSAVYIFDEEDGLYKRWDSRGSLQQLCPPVISKDDPVVLKMVSARGIVQDLKAEHIKICVPALSKRKGYSISGFLLADEKKSEDQFSQQDIMLLETIANQAVVSIDNAVLYSARIDARKKALLVERLNELGSSAAAVAHQTRAAMGPVIDFAAQLQQQYADRDFVGRALSKFPFDVERLRLILTGILEYSRELKLGRVEELDLKEMVLGVASLINGRAQEKGITVETDISDGALVKAEKGRFRDVLIYLAINCLEALQYGGSIRISAEKRGDKMRIYFSDNGPGVLPDVLIKVFNPFFTTKPGSIGLGLSIVKKIIEGHGGSVFMESEPGKGTTVILELPS